MVFNDKYMRGQSVDDWCYEHRDDARARKLRREWDIDDNVFKLKVSSKGIIRSSKKMVYWKCEHCGKVFMASPKQRIYNRMDCTFCSKCTSKAEIILYEILSKHYNNVISRDRHLRFELDIYLPDENLAIEHNGVYFHRIKHDKEKSDNHKIEVCKKKNIRLIQIWDDGTEADPVVSDDGNVFHYSYYRKTLDEQMEKIAKIIMDRIDADKLRRENTAKAAVLCS